jgi:hypothetical protein
VVRTAYEAVDLYKETFQRVLSCFAYTTIAVQVKRGYAPHDDPHVLTCNRGAPIALRGPQPLELAIRQAYRAVTDGARRLGAGAGRDAGSVRESENVVGIEGKDGFVA